MRWFTSDHHFGHENIIKFTKRPFSNVHQMNQAMVDNWNAVVSPGDIVFHLGDMGVRYWQFVKPYVDQLKGQIILIKGNHDKKETLDNFAWTKWMGVRIGPYHVILNHKPLQMYLEDVGKLTPEHKAGKWYESCVSREDAEGYDFQISGHVHELYLWNGRVYNVSVERHAYTPVSEDDVLRALRQGKA